jgi:hypothetical protein
MRLPAGRNVEIEERLLPMGSTWAFTLAYCAFSFGFFWFAAVRSREFFFILISGFFALFGFIYLFIAIRGTLDVRNFGAMKLRVAAPRPAVGARFSASLRISDSARLRGAVRAELRCNQVWFGRNQREEQTIWAEEKRFPIRHMAAGSYALLEFDVPGNLPGSEQPPEGGLVHGRRYGRWEIQAVAESEGAYRDELYAIQVLPGEGKGWHQQETAAAAIPAEEKTETTNPSRQEPRVPKPVEQVAEIAETPLPPPAQPDASAIVLLVAANLVPIAGVLFFGWKVQQVVFLYWMENLVIGGFNVLRILSFKPPGASRDEAAGMLLGKLALGAFFLAHYGGFCYGHGEFLAAMFGRDAGGNHLTVGGMLAGMLSQPFTILCLAALLVSHGWSFFRNYLGRGEYQELDVGQMMFAPYKRIVVTHLFIIFGGFAMTALKSQLLPMLVFIAVKTAADLYYHRQEHALRGNPAPSA